MEKEITIENLQQEVARLTAENESLKNANKELTESKEFWIRDSRKNEDLYKKLAAQVKSVSVIIGGMVA